MLSGRGKSLKNILISSSSLAFKTPTFSHQNTYLYSQVQTYVKVYQKWKKDRYLDSFESIHTSFLLKPIIALKNIMVSSSQYDDYSIPISTVSKMNRVLGIRRMKVSLFMRQYPSFFEEFVVEENKIPWFRLTQKAIDLHNEEQLVYQESKFDLIDRLKKLILMSVGVEKKLPMKIIKGMQWYLGLPDEYLDQPKKHLDGVFRLVDMPGRLKGLAIDINKKEAVISVMQANCMKSSIYNGEKGGHIPVPVMQANCMKRGVYSGEKGQIIEFPLFPSKGMRLRKDIACWLEEIQLLPYVSPYADVRLLDPSTDLAEKRVVGVLHELLSLFVDHAARRKAFIILKKHLGLPQKVHMAFERHPHMFYISTKHRNKTVILKEAYDYTSQIDAHPLARVRRKYVKLMMDSKLIFDSRSRERRRLRRSSKSSVDMIVRDSKLTLDSRPRERRMLRGSSKSSVDIIVRDLDPTEGERSEVTETECED